jgi:hypothetical protein
MTKDGLGWTFQCNVFGHFIIVSTTNIFLCTFLNSIQVRYLEDLLHRSPWTARVIWTSSYIALPPTDWEDWQNIKATVPYENTKYQCASMAHILDMEPDNRKAGHGRSPIRHLISHPSITSTSIYQNGLNFVTAWLMMLAMYLVCYRTLFVHAIRLTCLLLGPIPRFHLSSSLMAQRGHRSVSLGSGSPQSRRGTRRHIHVRGYRQQMGNAKCLPLRHPRLEKAREKCKDICRPLRRTLPSS